MRLAYVCALVAATAAIGSNANPTANDAGVIVNAKPLPAIPAAVPRGVLRDHAPRYEEAAAKKLFTCLDGSQTIPFDRVNDEYCDCKDGSDEPGTAACSLETINKKDWRFRCQDSGSLFKDRTFRHSQINDGICDCCDGSDEYAGHMSCPNTCAELAAEEDKVQKEREEKRRLGLEAKKKMEQDTTDKINAALKAVQENEAKMKEAEARLEAIKARKDAAETVERAEREVIAAQHTTAVAAWRAEQDKKLQGAAFLKPMWGCVRWGQTAGCKGDGVLEDLSNKTCLDLIASSSSGFCVCRKRTPEYLAKLRAGSANLVDDMAKRAAEIAAANGDAAAAADAVEVADDNDDEQPEDDKINKNQFPKEFNRQQEERLIGVEKEDTLLRFDCGHSPFTCEEMCEFGGDETIRAAHKEQYNGPAANDGSAHETEAAKAARNDYNTINNEKIAAERAVEEAKKTLERLQQEDITLAFRSMNGLCFERQLHNYKYSFCPFSRASQDHTSLGEWKGFGEQTYSSWGAKHDFSIMKFADGQQCWGGPKRSLTVRVVCGPTNEILQIDEPSMCTYVIRFQSPAICE